MPTIASSIHCAAYQCGHIGRSDDLAVKRALYLHLCRESGVEPMPVPGGDTDETLAVLALMREGRPCSEVRNYRTAGVTAATTPATPATTEEEAITITPQMVEVATLIASGYSYPEVARMTGRKTETVRSLAKRCIRAANAHTAMAAVAKMTEWGYL